MCSPARSRAENESFDERVSTTATFAAAMAPRFRVVIVNVTPPGATAAVCEIDRSVVWTKVAVYVAAPAGAVTSWFCAPPSDHPVHPYVIPPTVCGESAESEFVEPTMTRLMNGVASFAPPTVSVSPLGFVANSDRPSSGRDHASRMGQTMGIRRGETELEMRRIFVIGCRERTRRDAEKVWIGCSWHSCGQCMRTTCHERRDGLGAPSSASVACPLKSMVCPTDQGGCCGVDDGERRVVADRDRRRRAGVTCARWVCHLKSDIVTCRRSCRSGPSWP